MRIAKIYSHLNGLEFIRVHRPQLWDEILATIRGLNAELYRNKISQERNRIGEALYSPTEINQAFKDAFRDTGWVEHRQPYYLTDDPKTARKTMGLAPDDQRQAIIEAGFTPLSSYNQTDFMKDRVAIEIQFGKYAFVSYDLFVKHMAFFIADRIDVGIEIIPTKSMISEMSSGIAYYESEVYNLYRQGRNTPAVPLIIIGIEP